QILGAEVYLTEQIDIIASRTDLHQQKLHHLKAIVIMQPTKASLSALSTLLSTPRYKEYYLYFTNIIPPGYLDNIATADINDLVKGAYEMYMDYFVVSPTLFHFNNNKSNAGKRNEIKDQSRALID